MLRIMWSYSQLSFTPTTIPWPDSEPWFTAPQSPSRGPIRSAITDQLCLESEGCRIAPINPAVTSSLAIRSPLAPHLSVSGSRSPLPVSSGRPTPGRVWGPTPVITQTTDTHRSDTELTAPCAVQGIRDVSNMDVCLIWVWVEGLHPVGIWGHLQGKNIQSYNLFSLVIMITWLMKLGGNLPLGHDALLFLKSGHGSFICPVTQTRLDIPGPLFTQSSTTGGKSKCSGMRHTPIDYLSVHSRPR